MKRPKAMTKPEPRREPLPRKPLAVTIANAFLIHSGALPDAATRVAVGLPGPQAPVSGGKDDDYHPDKASRHHRQAAST